MRPYFEKYDVINISKEGISVEFEVKISNQLHRFAITTVYSNVFDKFIRFCKSQWTHNKREKRWVDLTKEYEKNNEYLFALTLVKVDSDTTKDNYNHFFYIWDYEKSRFKLKGAETIDDEIDEIDEENTEESESSDNETDTISTVTSEDNVAENYENTTDQSADESAAELNTPIEISMKNLEICEKKKEDSKADRIAKVIAELGEIKSEIE